MYTLLSSVHIILPRIAVSFLVPLCLYGMSGQAAVFTWADIKDAKPSSTITYQTHGEKALTLDVFTPPNFSTTESRPALLFIHGGSWIGGTPALLFPHCRYFALRGLVVFDAAYRLAEPGKATIFDCLQDCQAALRYIRTHAKELGVDPQRIVAVGDSSGGHLAASLGINMPIGGGMQEAPPWLKADAVILYDPIVDLTTLKWVKGTPGIQQDIAEGPGAGLTPDEKLRMLSPVFHIGKQLPPCLILHGTADIVVPIEQCARFAALMTQAENTCKLITLEGVNHAFIFPQYSSEAMVMRSLHEADTFLVSQGYLPREPEPSLR